jgi:hypothetical protein
MTPTRLLVLALAVGLATAQPTHAQFFGPLPVIDLRAIVEASRLVSLTGEARTILRTVKARLRDMRHYRTPPFVPTRYDPARYPGAAALLASLNEGDPTGQWYRARVAPIPALVPDDLLDEAGRIDEMDAIAGRAAHEAGAIGITMEDVMEAIDALERDVLNLDPDQSVAAILDKIAGSELLARRQQAVSHQLQTRLLELHVLEATRWREAEAESLLMQLGARAHATSESDYGGLDWTAFMAQR